MFQPSLIAAVDIGSPKAGNLGWATTAPERTGTDISELTDLICEALKSGAVALGFEAPLWVPLRQDVMSLTSARRGEGSRPWSAGAGTGALATGLVVVSYILSQIIAKEPSVSVSLDYKQPPTQPHSLFLWEAFVSQGNKGTSHTEDAMIAARAFERRKNDLESAQYLEAENNLNLLGAMLLRAGLSQDIGLLQSDLLVLKL